MPPTTTYIYSKRLVNAVAIPFYCPVYSASRLRLAPSGPALVLSKKHCASTLVSTTAVNATKAIPARNKNLHQALNELSKKASTHVSLSRLRLAIQGLESEHPTTRVALLGLDVPAAARRLTHLLLADSSRPKQEWESHLLGDESEQRRGVVIRFGNHRNEAIQAPRSALPVLWVPAPLLREQRIEILISSVNAPDPRTRSNGNTPSDVLLSPTVGTPASAYGRQSLISQPVHQTIIVSNGVHELLSAAALLTRTKFESPTERKLINIVLNLDGIVESSASRTIRVDLVRAKEALQAVRETFAKALDYEKAWEESGMPALSKLLISSSARSGQGLSPSLRELIASLLEAAAANIAVEAKEAELTARSKAISDKTRLALEDAINAFSEQGHTELQSGLAAAWSSRNWRKLAFWKLFWRVDDVPLIVADLITTAWLARTEGAVYELSGRLKQAGISLLSLSEPTTISEPQTSPISVRATAGEMASDTTGLPSILASTASTESASAHLIPPAKTAVRTRRVEYRTPPLATTISISRQTCITTAITTLTSSAQQIVLKALTITGASAALGALSFLSITTGSLYESGAIVAFGTAYALRRMQREWKAQCQDLENGLIEEGRSLLKQTEERMRQAVQDASQPVMDEVEVQLRREATEAVQKAKEAFSKHE